MSTLPLFEFAIKIVKWNLKSYFYASNLHWMSKRKTFTNFSFSLKLTKIKNFLLSLFATKHASKWAIFNIWSSRQKYNFSQLRMLCHAHLEIEITRRLWSLQAPKFGNLVDAGKWWDKGYLILEEIGVNDKKYLN